MTAGRPAGPRVAAHTSPLLLAASAPLLMLLLLACGNAGNEDQPEPATVAAAAGGVGVTTATSAPTEQPTLTEEDAAVAAWGLEVCDVISGFAVDFRASGDPRDPRELELEPRKERAAAMFPAQYDAVEAAMKALEGLEPPPRTAELHRLLLETYRELNAALEEQERTIAEATTTEEIEASNVLVDQLITLADRQAALLINAGYCD